MSFINALQWRSPAPAALLAMLALTGCAAGADHDPDAEGNPRADDSSGAATTAEPEPSAEPPSNSCTSPTAPRSSG